MSGTGAQRGLVWSHAGHYGNGLTVAFTAPPATHSVWEMLLKPWDHLQNQGATTGLNFIIFLGDPENISAYFSRSKSLQLEAYICSPEVKYYARTHLLTAGLWWCILDFLNK